MNVLQEATGFAKLFDHSIIRPDATRDQVRQFAETAARLGTATLTVQPHYISFAVDLLRGSGVLLGTVVGFPHGNETPSMKEHQARQVIDLGAEEIDMVMNIPALKNGERGLFIHDIQGVVLAAEGRKVKVITENCYLTEQEKRLACEWIAEAGAHFVKTSTAYAAGGATLEDVRLMYETRTDQFVREFQELPTNERAAFREYLPAMPGATPAAGAISKGVEHE